MSELNDDKNASSATDRKGPAAVSESPHLWKRIIVRALVFGISSGATLIIGAVAVFWYFASQPVTPPKAWNTKAITGSFVRLDTYSHEDSDKKTTDYIEFFYTLENHTDYDYSLTDDEILCSGRSSLSASHDWKLVLRLQKEQSIVSLPVPVALCIGNPIFLPARQRASVTIHVRFDFPKPTPAPDAPKETRDAYRHNLATYINERAPNWDGFVITMRTSATRLIYPLVGRRISATIKRYCLLIT